MPTQAEAALRIFWSCHWGAGMAHQVILWVSIFHPFADPQHRPATDRSAEQGTIQKGRRLHL